MFSARKLHAILCLMSLHLERILVHLFYYMEHGMSLKLRDGVYHWRKQVNGHKFSQSTKTADFKMAQHIASLLEADAVRSIVLMGTKPVLLHSVIKAFLDSKAGTPGAANAEVHLRHFLALPNIKMNELTLDQVNGVIAKRRASGTSHNTLCCCTGYWNALVAFATKQKWTTAVRLPPMNPTKTRIRAITVEEERALFAAIDPAAKYPGKCAINDKAKQDNTDLLIALFALGCRLTEATKMTWSQVNLESRQVLVIRVKGGIDGTLVMTDRLYEMLKRRKATATDQWVFPTKCVSANDYAWFSEAVERAGISQAGGRTTLHTIRHSCATRWLSKLNLIEVQQMLGHKNIASTMIYAHIEVSTVAKRAAEILNAL